MGRATGKNNKELGALQLLQGLFGTLGSAGRGLAAGTAGLPGDLESLVRLLPGLSEQTIMPTTEDVSNYLPKLPSYLQQPVAEGLGQMGAMTPGQVAKLGKAGKAGALALMDRALTPSRVAQAGAIKPRGGNWITEGPGSPKEELKTFMQSPLQRAVPVEHREAINDWINGPLSNYFKRDFASESDPVRQLFDQGIKHNDVENMINPLEVDMRNLPRYASEARSEAFARDPSDFMPGTFAKTQEGKDWEALSDSMMRTMNKEHVPIDQRLANPWIDRLPNDEPIYSLSNGFYDTDMGLYDIISSFKNAFAQGKLRPEQLKQMSMEKAVRFANEQRLAKETAEQARLAKQAAEAVGHGNVLKEYPEGYKWVDLAKPEKLEDMSKVRQNPDGTWSPVDSEGNVLQRIEVMGADPVDVVERTPEEAYLGGMLGHEGRMMDQCVGGYCQDVAAGNTRVLSLRGPDGRSHVTIEAQPRRKNQISGYGENSEVYSEDMPDNLLQIKGAKNSRPKDEYQPFITDLVRSHKFDIGDDLGNTNLQDINDYKQAFQDMVRSKMPDSRYFTNEELNPLLDEYYATPGNGFATKDYAKGGLVEGNDDFAYPGFF